MNARSARAWLVEKLGERGRGPEALRRACRPTRRRSPKFGIDTANMFAFWDWVGGRYSLWSAIGLSIALRRSAWTTSRSCSPAATRWTSTSAPRRSRRTCRSSSGMLGVWYANFFGAADARDPALRPVPAPLRRLLPAGRHGEQRQARRPQAARVIDDYTTGPVIWGEPGTNGQHAFYQLIHQGTRLIPCDFLAPVETHNPLGKHHDDPARELLRADRGADEGQDARRRRAPSSRRRSCRPSASRRSCRTRRSRATGRRRRSSFTKLTPRTLGMLDRDVRAQDLRAGHRLGHLQLRSVGRGARQAAREEDRARSSRATAPVTTHDASTNGLINRYKKHHGRI